MVNKTDTQIPQLIINKLTKEQYEQALAQGLISETELYAVTDEDDYVTVNTFNNIIANYTPTENLSTVALSGEYSSKLYDEFNKVLSESIHVETGIFGADMEVDITNIGPTTIMLER